MHCTASSRAAHAHTYTNAHQRTLHTRVRGCTHVSPFSDLLAAVVDGRFWNLFASSPLLPLLHNLPPFIRPPLSLPPSLPSHGDGHLQPFYAARIQSCHEKKARRSPEPAAANRWSHTGGRTGKTAGEDWPTWWRGKAWMTTSRSAGKESRSPSRPSCGGRPG